MNEENIKLHNFDPNTFFQRDKPFCAIFSAARNSGKSNLLKHFYLNYFYPKHMFDVVILFSQTTCNDFYTNFLNTKLIYSRYDKDAMASLMKKCKDYEAKGKKLRALVIVDDCISSKDKYDAMLTSCFTQGRHFNMSLIYVTQKLGYCSNTWFNNSNLLVFLRNPSRAEKKYIADKVLIDPLSCVFPDTYSETKMLNICNKMISNKTRDYQALIVTPLEKLDPNIPDEEIYKHKIFTYKAPDMN